MSTATYPRPPRARLGDSYPADELQPVAAVRVATMRRESEAADRVAAWGLAAIYLLLAYEWLISGINKIVSSEFRSGLAGELQEAVDGNPDRHYAHFLTGFAIPNATTLAPIVAWGEVLVGVSLIAGAVRWAAGARLDRRQRFWIDSALIVGLLGAALMTANYYLMDGGGIPWIDAKNAFDEGISIDALLTFVSVALLAMQVAAVSLDRHREA
jgi:thiosulfate dehydrogenase [quinone] large subunit